MVKLVKCLIKAQRVGDFPLYLKTLKDMLPFFASSGHWNYTRCVYLYIQDMTDLQEKNKTLFDQLMSGHFVIRRSERYWAGLSPDLVIEHTGLDAFLENYRWSDKKQRNWC